MPKGPGPNEVGAAWTKSNDRGPYLSISLNMDALLELAGGVVSGTIYLSAYPLEFEKTNPNSPDYRLKFFPRTGAQQPRLPVPPVAPRPPSRHAPPPPARRPTHEEAPPFEDEPPPPDDDDGIPF